MKIRIILLCCLLVLGGCAELRRMTAEGGGGIIGEPQADRLLSGHDFLACLDETEPLTREELETAIESVEKKLADGRAADTLRFVCLSLHAKADYEQFKHGTMILEQYLQDHPEAGSDLQGFRILIERLDYEIRNKWSSWKTLLNEKKALKAEIVSLQARVEELQKQIDQLKKIEEIIKSREMEHQ